MMSADYLTSVPMLRSFQSQLKLRQQEVLVLSEHEAVVPLIPVQTLASGLEQTMEDEPKANILEHPLRLHFISRDRNVTVTSDVRGNLGPCSVVVQDPPGTDWLKDRWQAASDMGGTAIPGSHFITLDFKQAVVAHAVYLDWETAFAEQYRLEVKADSTDTEWTLLFDGTMGAVGPSPFPNQRLATPGRTTTTSGHSPGIGAQNMPLHVIHAIELDQYARAVSFRIMRLFIVKPAVGWGVSLWQFDVLGSNV